jgi:hypothetical protein
MTSQANENARYEGLGGWLILVGIGLVLSPLLLLVTLWTEFLPGFDPDRWRQMTDPDSEYYNQYWAPIFLAEFGVNILMLLLGLVLLWLFFTKSRFFPTLYIFATGFGLAFLMLDAFIVSQAFPDTPMFDEEFTRSLLRSSVGALIWISYMLVSKRVKATFVR